MTIENHTFFEQEIETLTELDMANIAQQLNAIEPSATQEPTINTTLSIIADAPLWAEGALVVVGLLVITGTVIALSKRIPNLRKI